MNTFVKWFLVNAVVLTALFFAESKGALSTMIANDNSYICVVIMTLYVLVSAYIGRLSFLADNTGEVDVKKEKERLLKQSETGWFAAEHLFSLGLLGTVYGLSIATATHVNAEANVKDVVAALKIGLSTAFYTTICGIIFSLPLQVQLMVLKFKLEK